MLASETVGLPSAIPFPMSRARSRMFRSRSNVSGDFVEASGSLSTISRKRIEIERSAFTSAPKAIAAADFGDQEGVARTEARGREPSVIEIWGDGFALAAPLSVSAATRRVIFGKTVLLSRSLSGLTTAIVDVGGGASTSTSQPQSARALSRSFR